MLISFKGCGNVFEDEVDYSMETEPDSELENQELILYLLLSTKIKRLNEEQSRNIRKILFIDSMENVDTNSMFSNS